MTLICPQCQARLQLEDSKTPSGPFTVRCPKCQAPVKLQPLAGANENSSFETTRNPAGGFQLERQLAPRFSLDGDEAIPFAEARGTTDFSGVAKLLAEALQNADELAGGQRKRKRKMRKVMVCAAPDYQDEAARALASGNYEVFVAQNIAQALGSMREESMDVLLLDANFDPVEQGTAFVMREIKLLRPAQRRRLFVVYVSPQMRTMDLHAAFLQNVNMVFNPSDLDRLPEALEASIRNYNELYRDFFTALNVQPI